MKLDLELLQTFIRITSVAPGKCIAHIGHPEKADVINRASNGKYTSVAYDGNIEVSFNAEKEVLMLCYDYDKKDFKLSVARKN